MSEPRIPTTAVPLAGWGQYYGGSEQTPFPNVTAVVAEYLGDDDQPRAGLAAAYRAAINSAINHHGVYLNDASVFWAVPDSVPTAEDVIVQAIEHVDLNVVADRYEQHQEENA